MAPRRGNPLEGKKTENKNLVGWNRREIGTYIVGSEFQDQLSRLVNRWKQVHSTTLENTMELYFGKRAKNPPNDYVRDTHCSMDIVFPIFSFAPGPFAPSIPSLVHFSRVHWCMHKTIKIIVEASGRDCLPPLLLLGGCFLPFSKRTYVQARSACWCVRHTYASSKRGI